jgi:hypothetical protein
VEKGPEHIMAEYMPMGRAPLSLEVVILHWGLYTTVNRVHFDGKASQRLCTLRSRVDRHDIMINVFTSSPLPLVVHGGSILLWSNAEPSIVPG